MALDDQGGAADSDITHVMVRLKPPELDIVDTLITAGIANSRAEAIRWALARISERPAYAQLRELTRARRGGGSTRRPAWSRSRCAPSPQPGTTGSPRSGSGSGGPVRRTWPGCTPRGIRWPAGTGPRMRRRSGWCWTAWTRGPWPGPCSGDRAAAGAAGDRRPVRAATAPGRPPGSGRR